MQEHRGKTVPFLNSKLRCQRKEAKSAKDTVKELNKVRERESWRACRLNLDIELWEN